MRSLYLRHLRQRRTSEAQCQVESLLLQIGQRREPFLDRTFTGRMGSADNPQVHHIKNIDAKIAQIVMYRLGERSAGLCAGFQDASAPRTAPTLVLVARI